MTSERNRWRDREQPLPSAFLLLCVAALVSGVGYALELPRLIVVVGLVCLTLGAATVLWASFVNARTQHESFGRSVGRAIKDAARLVLDLVP